MSLCNNGYSLFPTCFLRKSLIFFFLLLFSLPELKSQTINFYGAITDNYPIINAKFVALDKDGNQLSDFNISDFILKSDKSQPKIISVSCPPMNEPKKASVVLMFDVSGSMGIDRANAAKTAGKRWVELMPPLISECAIATFNTFNNLILDFTTDKTLLNNAIESIKFGSGGTDFNAALLNEPAGAIRIAAKGKFNKYVILLTDGEATGNVEEIIKLARFYDVTVFAVVIQTKASVPLEAICSGTNGKQYANINNTNDLLKIYEEIFLQIQKLIACDLVFQDKSCEIGRVIQIEIPRYNLKGNLNYYVSLNNLSTIRYLPGNMIIFNNLKLDSSFIKTVNLTALYDSLTIFSINSSDTLFKIVDYGGTKPPFFLNKDESRDIKIQYTPKDSGLHFSQFTLNSSACINNNLVAKGFIGSSLANKTLKVVFPNGGEKLIAGADTTLFWTGVPLGEPVMLKYSTNGGIDWFTASLNQRKLEYTWQVPKKSSDSCLLMAVHYQDTVDYSIVLKGHKAKVNTVAWKPGSDRILASGSDDKSVIVWDVVLGKILNILEGLGTEIFALSWSPDGSKLACTGLSGKIFIFETKSFSLLKTIETNHRGAVISIKWDAKGSLLATASNDGDLKIFDSGSGSMVDLININDGGINDMDWSPDNKYFVVTTFNFNCILYEASSKKIIYTYQSKVEINKVAFSPYSDKFVFSSFDGKLNIYDIYQNKLSPFSSYSSGAMSWDPLGDRIASGKGSRIYSYDVTSQLPLQVYRGESFLINSLSWNKINFWLAGGDNDSNIVVWDGFPEYQNDVSDSLWSIIYPKISSVDIDMGKVALGFAKDSVVTSFIKNIGSGNVTVKNIRIVNNDSTVFRILSGYPPYNLKPGESASIELRFQSLKLGPKNARIMIITQSDTIYQNLKGEIVKAPILLSSNIIDFGEVEIFKSKILTRKIIKNLDSAHAYIIDASLSGPDSIQFSIVKGDGMFILNPLEEKELTVAFHPKALGRTSGSIKFVFDDATSPIYAQLFGEGIAQCDSTGFEYDNFLNNNNLSLINHARLKDSIIRLTSTFANQSGAVWYNKPVNLTNGFTVDFQFRISEGKNINTTEKSYPGADGLAFVIQNAGPEVIGLPGGGLGYDGIPNSIAVEFDMFSNDSLQIENYYDPDGNHIAIQSGGIGKNSARHKTDAQIFLSDNLFTMKSDSTVYCCKIVYDAKLRTLSLYFDYNSKPYKKIVEIPEFEPEKFINLQPGGRAFVGFTASTGSSWQNHDLIRWSLCPKSSIINDVENMKISKIINSEDIEIFPNPAENIVTVEFPYYGLTYENSQFHDISVSLVDIFGIERINTSEKTLYNDKISFQININQLNPSIYFIKINTLNNIFYKKLIIK